MARRNVLQSWILGFGGTKTLAEVLGVAKHTVDNWYYGRQWPKVQNILDLIELSKGELTFELIIKHSKTPKSLSKQKLKRKTKAKRN